MAYYMSSLLIILLKLYLIRHISLWKTHFYINLVVLLRIFDKMSWLHNNSLHDDE